MNILVKIIFDDDGLKVENPVWHMTHFHSDSRRTVCTGEVYGAGEGSAIFKEKETDRGGITCKRCLEIIKWYKSIKL